MHEVINRKIVAHGSRKDIDEARKFLLSISKIGVLNESEARISIQNMIDQNRIKADILYDGNTVWSFKKTIRDFKKVLKSDSTHNSLTDYLYRFFSLCCGTIAHYDRYGWCCVYPDVESLRQLLMKNEFGSPVLEYQPHWATDRKRIIEEMKKVSGI